MVLRSPNLDRYDNNAVVQLIAIPDPGFRFDSWGGDIAGEVGTRDILMNDNKTISANFVLDVSDGYNKSSSRGKNLMH